MRRFEYSLNWISILIDVIVHNVYLHEEWGILLIKNDK